MSDTCLCPLFRSGYGVPEGTTALADEEGGYETQATQWFVVTDLGGGSTEVVVGDDDGVIVIPRELAEDVVDAALAKEREDTWVAERVAEGNPVKGLFPPTGQWQEEFQQWLAEHPASDD